VTRWPVLVVLGAAQFLMVLDQAVMNVAISQLVADFDTTVTTRPWWPGRDERPMSASRLRGAICVTVLDAVVLLVLADLFDGFHLDDFGSALLLAPTERIS
jgi:hypothetical protein